MQKRSSYDYRLTCTLLLALPFLPSQTLAAQSQLLAPSHQEAAENVASSLPDAPGRDSSSQSSSSSVSQAASSIQTASSTPIPAGTASITGTVLDSTGALVPNASVTLIAANKGVQTHTADSGADFTFTDLAAGTYEVAITFPGLTSFAAHDLTIAAGQHYELSNILLTAGATNIDVQVIVSLKEQAEDQVKNEINQRAFGLFPNFYVVYDPHFAPLTTRLKFKLAVKAATDPITFGAAAFVGGINQAADNPGYVQGAKGYGQRLGAAYANGASDILIGGAILPTLFHQDPRYFYQGTGSKRSRAIHALSSPFIAKGDNGRPQINYSSIGGDLASASLSNIYYPPVDRGAGLVFSNALITTSGRMLNALAQEFILRKITTKPKY